MGTHASIFSELIKSGFSTAKNLLVPPICLMCENVVDEQGGCCPQCWIKIRFISKPYCDVLGIPFTYDLGEGTLSADAIANPPAFRKLRSAVLYDEHIRRLVSQFKYSDRTELGPWMANWMIRAGEELIDENKLIIPIPLHWRRLWSRKYNQSAELSWVIAKKTNLVFEPRILKRSRNTKQQVGLSGREREKNVQGAFQIRVENAHLVKGKNILLVDDVYTTGATVNAATKTLLRAGALSVDVLTFARVEIFDL